MKKCKIIHSLISIGTYEAFTSHIFSLEKELSSSYVCISNVHMTIEVFNDKIFENIVNSANIITPDGMPIAKTMNYLYGIKQARVSGMDLVIDVMKKCEEEDKSIFVYGLTDETLGLFEKQALLIFPKLRVKSYSPPFRTLNNEEKKEIIETINDFNPSFVFVALGCPKQEKWMSEHHNKIKSCMIGLGGALEVYAGVKNRAPKWMQEYSLEWLYRLIQDPKRLWKRYFYTNSLFIVLFLKQYLIVKILSKKPVSKED